MIRTHILSLVSVVFGATSYYPMDHQFFYLDLMHEVNENNFNKSTYYVEMELEDKSKPTGAKTFKLLPTSNEQGIEIPSTNCMECKPPKSDKTIHDLDPNSTTIKLAPNSVEMDGLDIYQTKGNQLYSNIFKMTQYIGKFTSIIHIYGRIVNFGEVTFNIINSCKL